jgi:hypothetical protein
MTYSIEDLKGQVSRSGGIAAGNMYRVILPVLPNYPAQTKSLDLLCTAASIPGRQIMSMDYQMGTTMRKIANGYATTDMQLTFIATNDHVARAYFEAWQNLAHDPNTLTVGYYKDYTFPVKIEHLQKGAAFPILKKQLGFTKKIPSFIKNRLPKIGPFDLAQDEVDLNATFGDKPVYTVVLNECFPTTINEIALSNGAEGLVEFSVQLSYKDWTSGRFKPDSNLGASVVGAGIDMIRSLFG